MRLALRVRPSQGHEYAQATEDGERGSGELDGGRGLESSWWWWKGRVRVPGCLSFRPSAPNLWARMIVSASRFSAPVIRTISSHPRKAGCTLGCFLLWTSGGRYKSRLFLRFSFLLAPTSA